MPDGSSEVDGVWEGSDEGIADGGCESVDGACEGSDEGRADGG